MLSSRATRLPPDLDGSRLRGELPQEGILRLRRTRGFFQRLKGLHAINRLEPDEGLWIQPCKGIHTCGLKYAIDAAFLSREHRILRVVEALPPYRFAMHWQACSVIELPAGYIAGHPDLGRRIKHALRHFPG